MACDKRDKGGGGIFFEKTGNSVLLLFVLSWGGIKNGILVVGVLENGIIVVELLFDTAIPLLQYNGGGGIEYIP